jgi:hypothetical protein
MREIKDGDIFLIDGLEYKIAVNTYAGGYELLPNQDCTFRFNHSCLKCKYNSNVKDGYFVPRNCRRDFFTSTDDLLQYLKQNKAREEKIAKIKAGDIIIIKGLEYKIFEVPCKEQKITGYFIAPADFSNCIDYDCYGCPYDAVSLRSMRQCHSNHFTNLDDFIEYLQELRER